MITRYLAQVFMIVVCCAEFLSASELSNVELSIVPKPAQLELRGGSWSLERTSRIVARDGARVEAQQLAKALSALTGWDLAVVEGPARDGDIEMALGASSSLRPEGYQISVAKDRVTIKAPAEAGLFYGGITVAQLLARENSQAPLKAPCVEITDQPRFAWRGLLLDPARHFLDMEFLKKFVDTMSFYKFNRLQLHLTDDQGWRIEIKRDPLLTQVGSVRKQSPKRGDRSRGDGQVYGPFYYTQEQIRHLVKYAKARHVTIVPEIEIPGHFGAAIAAHPEFSCAGRASGRENPWGSNADILCPGNDAAIEFVKGVLAEICELFDSEFIHIGGDEVPRERWKKCAKCQARMKAEGLTNEAQLQTWLNHRLEEYLASRVRRMVGWDEILEGGLTPGAVVMSWRGSQGGIDSAKAGHDVIMSPTTHCYFDYAQAKAPGEPESIGGFIPIETVYSFNPEPEELNASQRRHILGTQGNLWGEYMWDGRDVEYFAFPRALALAEVAWSPQAGRSFDDFCARLPAQYRRLDELKVNYRKPEIVQH